VRALLGLQLLQGTIGYTQYATGIPEALVAVHILGAALVWMTTVFVWVRARPLPGHRRRRPHPTPTRDGPPEPQPTPQVTD
jgi:heme a synthase